MNITEMNKLFEECDCGREHKCPIDYVKIGKDALPYLKEICNDYNNILLVCDENTNRVCAAKVEEVLLDKIYKKTILVSNGKVVVPNEESIATIQNEICDRVDLIIGVGSGVINDLCKYVSFNNNLPYHIVATAPSMDGYASVGSALILKGMKVTVNARPPKAIVADTDVLKNAPYDMLQAGYGDIVGKYSCLNDWKLSALINNEYFCQKVYDYTFDCAKKITDLADGIKARDSETVGILMEALVTVGVLMSYVNSSRPASGSEHHLSHFFEITGILENKDYFAHGIDVLFSSYYTQKVREELLNLSQINATEKITEQEYAEKINSIYHGLSPEVLALQKKLGWYEMDKFATYKEKWEAIKEILSETPSTYEMEAHINKIGLELKAFEELYGDEKIQNAIWFAKDLKDRYSVLWLYFDLLYKEKR